MNILQIVPELRSGGVERGTVDFAQYLIQKGHKSVVISNGGSLVGPMLENGVTHHTLPVHKKNLFTAIVQIKKVAEIIQNEKIDIVHARSRVPAWIAFFACRKTKTVFLTTCHGIYSTHLLSRVMGWGKKVIAISHAVSRHMKENFSVPYQRIKLIHRGVNLREFQEDLDIVRKEAKEKKSERKFKILIVGRITPIKGHPILLKAMARVIRVVPEAELIIVGESPKKRYIENLKHLTERLGIASQVKFIGRRNNIPEILRSSDLLVAPAVGEEAFGRVLIEAGACQVPVIASRIGGIVDVIEHGKDGMLVPAGDAGALAEAILGVYREPEYAKRLSEAFQKKVWNQFSDTRMFDETISLYQSVIKDKNILVIKLSALGDVVLSVPSIRAIKNRYPNSKITVLTNRSNRELLRHFPYIDDLIVANPIKSYQFNQIFKLSKVLAKKSFDVSIDLQNNRLSHLLSYLSGASERIGYSVKKWDNFINHSIKNDEQILDPIQHQFRLLNLLDVKTYDPRLELATSTENDQWVDQFLKDHWVGKDQLLVGINPGSSPYWKTKQWLPDRFAVLCDSLSKKNIRVVITGSQEDQKVAEYVSKLVKTKPIIAAGRTSIGQLVSLIKKCHVYITSDSAPMHIALAVGTPYIALFGPTDPRRHAVTTRDPHKIFWKKVKCSPCYLKKCPIGLVCMKKISPDEVLNAIDDLIATTTDVTEEKDQSADTLNPADLS